MAVYPRLGSNSSEESSHSKGSRTGTSKPLKSASEEVLVAGDVDEVGGIGCVSGADMLGDRRSGREKACAVAPSWTGGIGI